MYLDTMAYNILLQTIGDGWPVNRRFLYQTFYLKRKKLTDEKGKMLEYLTCQEVVSREERRYLQFQRDLIFRGNSKSHFITVHGGLFQHYFSWGKEWENACEVSGILPSPPIAVSDVINNDIIVLAANGLQYCKDDSYGWRVSLVILPMKAFFM